MDTIVQDVWYALRQFGRRPRIRRPSPSCSLGLAIGANSLIYGLHPGPPADRLEPAVPDGGRPTATPRPCSRRCAMPSSRSTRNSRSISCARSRRPSRKRRSSRAWRRLLLVDLRRSRPWCWPRSGSSACCPTPSAPATPGDRRSHGGGRRASSCPLAGGPPGPGPDRRRAGDRHGHSPRRRPRPDRPAVRRRGRGSGDPGGSRRNSGNRRARRRLAAGAQGDAESIRFRRSGQIEGSLGSGAVPNGSASISWFVSRGPTPAKPRGAPPPRAASASLRSAPVVSNS